ncbi:MAG: hypothetical protein ABL963_00400 [Longimicrobiales bacterium]
MTIEERALRAIGIRVAPREVHYAVVEASAGLELLTTDSVVVPPALDLPAQLHFIRTTVLDIMAEYEVRRAGIRLTEPNAKGTSVERLNLEGVIQELLNSSDVVAYFAGPIATIAARLGEKERARVKGYFEGTDFLGIEGWGGFSREQRESVVTAVAAARLPEPHV